MGSTVRAERLTAAFLAGVCVGNFCGNVGLYVFIRGGGGKGYAFCIMKMLILKIGLYFATHSFARRCVSTLLLFALLFCVVYFGKEYGAVALATIVSTCALYEFYKLADHFGGKPRTLLGVILGAALVPFFCYSAVNESGKTKDGVPVLLAISGLVFLFGLFVMWKKQIPAWTKAISTAFGLLYIPLAVGFYAMLVGFKGMDGVLLCVWIVLAAKFTDIGGLIVGCRWGKHKLAPSVSPQKTWEGVAGGLVFSMAGSALLVLIFNECGAWSGEIGVKSLFGSGFSPMTAALYAIPISAASIVSDLIESAFKRCAGDKDSGSTIPGIGGALDLLDSLIFAAPVGFALVEYAM